MSVSSSRGRLNACARALRDPAIARLVVGFFGFRLAETITWTATLVYAYRQDGAFAVGVLAFGVLVPGVIIAPLASFCGDRFHRVKVLVASYLGIAGSSLATGLLADADVNRWWVYAAATGLATVVTFPRPAMGALLQCTVRGGDDLTAANVGLGLARSLAIAGGPVVTALVLLTGNLPLLFYLCAALALFSASLVVKVPLRRGVLTEDERMTLVDFRSEALAGLALVRRDPTIMLLLGVLGLSTMMIGFLDVAGVVVALDLLGESEDYAGWLAAATGVGSIAGSAIAVGLVGARRLGPALVVATIAQAVPLVALAATHGRAAALLAFGLCGVGIAVADVAGQTFLQRVSPDDVMARVYGVLEGFAMASLAIGSIAFSLLHSVLTLPQTLVAAMVGVVAVAALVARPLLALDRNRRPPDQEIVELLRATPIFAPLPAQTLERLSQVATRREPAIGAQIVTEGQPAFSMFVIGEGTVEITRGGVVVDRVGAGDYFGEVALLDDAPRNATVTAESGTVLWELGRDDFIEAVTGYPRAESRAHAAASRRRPPKAAD